MSFLKKKNVILCGLIGLLLIASYMNYSVFDKTKPTAETDNPINAELVNSLAEEDIMNGATKITDSFFTDYRMEREKVRSENISTLEKITKDENASRDNVDNAQATIINLTKQTERELLVENMIKSKGFSDCVVFLHEGFVNVLVDTKSITSQQAVQIQDIIAKECGIDLSKITIAVSGNEKK